MKLFIRFSILAVFVIGYFVVSYLFNSDVDIVKVSVTPDSYLIDGRRKSLAEAVEIVKSYENQGYQICLEFNASKERLSAITDEIHGIAYKRIGFVNKVKCQ